MSNALTLDFYSFGDESGCILYRYMTRWFCIPEVHKIENTGIACAVDGSCFEWYVPCERGRHHHARFIVEGHDFQAILRSWACAGDIVLYNKINTMMGFVFASGLLKQGAPYRFTDEELNLLNRAVPSQDVVATPAPMPPTATVPNAEQVDDPGAGHGSSPPGGG